MLWAAGSGRVTRQAEVGQAVNLTGNAQCADLRCDVAFEGVPGLTVLSGRPHHPANRLESPVASHLSTCAAIFPAGSAPPRPAPTSPTCSGPRPAAQPRPSATSPDSSAAGPAARPSRPPLRKLVAPEEPDDRRRTTTQQESRPRRSDPLRLGPSGDPGCEVGGTCANPDKVGRQPATANGRR